MSKRLGSEMRQHDPLRLELIAVRHHRPIRDVRRIVAVEIRGLADEEVGAFGDRDKVFSEARVPGVRDQLSRDLDAEPVRLGQVNVAHRQRGHARPAEFGRVRAEHDGAEWKAERGRPEKVGKERLLFGAKPQLERGRPADNEWLLAPREVLLDHKERDPAEVVAVKVSDRNGIDRRGVDVLLDRGQRRPAAIEEKGHARRGDVDRGVGAPAVAERVPTAEELNAEGHATSLSATGRPSFSDLRAARAMRSASIPSRTVQAFSASPLAKRRKCASSARYAASKRTKNVGYAGFFIFGPSRSTDDIGVRGSRPIAMVSFAP